MRKYLILILICIAAKSGCMASVVDEELFSEKKYDKILASEFVLSNGMKVCLKPTTFEKDEISIKLIAKGGFSLVDPSKRAMAELSSEIFLESGFAGFTCDKLSALMYETGTDFTINVGEFNRSLEAACAFDNIDLPLKLINLTFTKPNFNEKACKTVVERVKQLIKKRDKDLKSTFEANYMAINTSNCAAFRSLTFSDLERFDCKLSEIFFEDAFSNPADFTCVIVGDFEEEKLKLKLEKYLATIPSKALSKTQNIHQPMADFPEKIILKQVQQEGVVDSLVRLTFPIKIKLDQKNISCVEVACKVIEETLRQEINTCFQGLFRVDVAYAFPLYPNLDPSWLFLEFSCPPASVNKITEMILSQLKLLQTAKNISFNIENRKTRQENEYWFKQNDFWLANLSNYYLIDWNPNHIIKDVEKEKKLSNDAIQHMISTMISLTNYTLIWTTP